ncbi:MAG TPA: TonB-dependent receptor [Gemmatimonadota bacterium]|nr:TonB-dependent receptor [Gemmatimonadota bacterium]
MTARIRSISWVMLGAALWAGPASAQDVPAEASAAPAALATCTSAAEAGDPAAAAEAADQAKAGFERWRETRPDDPEPRVGLAKVLLQCRIPFAAFMEQGAISARAGEILRAALELDPTHWEARYLLALNYYHNPEFMGLTDDAIREFETLLDQQDGRTDFPEMAGPYAWLGDLYLRTGRAEDARAVWQRGAALFPSDERLAERLGRAAPDGAEGADGEPISGSAGAPTIDYQAEPLVVNVDAGYAMDDTRPQATLSKVDVYMAPGGTADILQVFQMLPGVTRASEGSDLFVRGGDPAEAPVFVEGARLLYPGVFETLHGGIFGILDPAVLRRAYFSSGGFSARWGNALSGIVDLETDGAPTVAGGRLGMNFVGGGATVRRPLGARAGIWTSVRATDTSLLLALQDQSDDYPSTPRSIEGVVGATFAPRRGVELKAVALAEGDGAARDIDAIGWRGPFESRGRTALALLSGRLLAPDAGAALRATASWSRRSTGFEFGVLDRERVDERVELRVTGDLGADDARQLRFGVDAAALEAREDGRVPTTERVDPGSPFETLDGSREETSHLGAFVEAEIRPLRPLAVVAGARVDRLPGEADATLDPRVAIAWRAGDWTWRAAGGTFQQGRWRAGYEIPDGGMPAGIPRRARHLAFGVEREGRPAVRLEAFTKAYDRYVPEEDDLEIEGGRASGVDALVQWPHTDRWGGWLAYSLLRGRLDLVEGSSVPSEVDVTHSLTAVATRTIGAWQIGTTARYATGRPYTPAIGAIRDGGFPEPVHGEWMSRRLPDYVRLDARLTRFQRIGGRFTVFYLEALNVLDRANASGVVYDADWKNARFVDSFFADRTLVAGAEIDL